MICFAVFSARLRQNFYGSMNQMLSFVELSTTSQTDSMIIDSGSIPLFSRQSSINYHSSCSPCSDSPYSQSTKACSFLTMPLSRRPFPLLPHCSLSTMCHVPWPLSSLQPASAASCRLSSFQGLPIAYKSSKCSSVYTGYLSRLSKVWQVRRQLSVFLRFWARLVSS